MPTAKLSSKNQITIPKKIIETLGLEAGDQLSMRVEKNRLVLEAPPKVKTPTQYIYGSVRKRIDAVKAIRKFRSSGGRA